MDSILIQFLEVLGTVAFAVSGALIAVSCSLDLFGVIFTGCITACGGGIIRDMLSGKIPPAVFENTYIIFIAALSSLTVFIVAYKNRHHFDSLRERLEKINNIFDAIGLSVFSVVGTEAVYLAGFEGNKLFCILMGMITGVGGGILRDVLTVRTPYVLKKHVYALASLIGSGLYFMLRIHPINTVIAAAIAMCTVFAIRMFATIYLWQLPKIKFDKESL